MRWWQILNVLGHLISDFKWWHTALRCAVSCIQTQKQTWGISELSLSQGGVAMSRARGLPAELPFKGVKDSVKGRELPVCLSRVTLLPGWGWSYLHTDVWSQHAQGMWLRPGWGRLMYLWAVQSHPCSSLWLSRHSDIREAPRHESNMILSSSLYINLCIALFFFLHFLQQLCYLQN